MTELISGTSIAAPGHQTPMGVGGARGPPRIRRNSRHPTWEGTMKGFAVLMVVLAFAVCATTTLATAADFRGEVWTWDEKEGWVTLRMGAQDVRVLVADKNQLKSLQLHSMATIRGELAPQVIETVMIPAPAGVFVPVGTPVEGSARARVVSVDP